VISTTSLQTNVRTIRQMQTPEIKVHSTIGKTRRKKFAGSAYLFTVQLPCFIHFSISTAGRITRNDRAIYPVHPLKRRS